MRASLLLLLAGMALAPLVGCRDGTVEDARPDLVLVIIDTWRWDALGANGSARDGITPHLDALAARGLRFERAFATSPWTLTSVASVLTGHYPTVHGAYGRYKDVTSIRPEVPGLAESLGAAGYRTLAVVNAPFLDPTFGFQRGFEEFDYYPSTNKRARRAAPSVDAALDLVERSDDGRPVFLLLHLFDPHLAYDPPPPWDRKFTGDYDGPLRPPVSPLIKMRSGTFDPPPEDREYMRALYDGEVAYTDAELGRFFEALAGLRPDRGRMIVVTADHGEEFGEHGGWEHGHTMYREQVQVPLILVPPEDSGLSPGVVSSQVRLVDVAPTLLETAGLEPAGDLPGRSLLGLADGTDGEGDRLAYAEREHLGRPAAALRNGRRSLILFLEEGQAELYDPLVDPEETTDRAGGEPREVDRLTEELRALAQALAEHADLLGGEREIEDLDPELLERLRSLGYVGG